ncbi:hypothetical protein B0H14DRAFT_2325139, partial [Mycena olivaceomarginata]
IQKGSDRTPWVQGGDYGTALATASWYGMTNIVPMLLQRGMDVNARGGKYGCALNTALSNGREKIAWLLIENGADMNVQ